MLASIQKTIKPAALQSTSAEIRNAWEDLESHAELLNSPAYWERMRVEVTEPLAAVLTAEAAAIEGAAAEELEAEVELAEALALRPCAHLGCTTILGPGGGEVPRGKRCGGCRLLRYCGAACQKADWPGHKTACRELQARSAA